MMGLEDVVQLPFLVVGNKLNVCDTSFGNIKRRLRNTDAVSPEEMMEIVQESTVSNFLIPGVLSRGGIGKNIFGKHLNILHVSKFLVSKVHEFNAKYSNNGNLFVIELNSR